MTDEKQGTSADIIAEMRMGNAGDFPFAYMIGDTDTPEVVDITTKAVIEPRKINIRRVTISNLADRLESAWKREKRGNAAAMREALVQCELFLGNVSRHGHPTLNPGDKCTACNGVDELRGMVVHALSTPARNCDLARDWLQDLYCKFKPPAIVRREMPPEWVDAVMAFCKWLLAPAAERKGETKNERH